MRSTDPRRLVIRGLARIERSPHAAGQSILRALLDGPDARDLDPRDRGLVTELFYGVLRRRLQLDAVIGRFARKGVPSDPELANILRVGVYQLLHLDRVPDRAAVHTAVSQARRRRGDKVGRFVNGVLRAIARERPEPESLAERYAHPQWMVARFRDELGDRLEARLQANMTAPPMDVRLHPSQTDPAPTDSEGLRRGIREGRWIPQDPASRRVVELLDPQPGDRVLELCAGRGVKSTQVADAIGTGGRLISLDLSPGKLAEAVRLMARWAPDVSHATICADASRRLPLSEELRFDRVLIDAPCSGLGVIRRRPETLWRRKPSDIATLATLQKSILEVGRARLKPGGVLVYAVCTTTPEETTAVLEGPDGFCTTPEDDGVDGFYAVRITE